MDGVRKKRKLKFKRNIQKKQTQQNNFDGWFNELEFPEQRSKTVNKKIEKEEQLISREKKDDINLNINNSVEQEAFENNAHIRQINTQSFKSPYSIDDLNNKNEGFQNQSLENFNSSKNEKQINYSDVNNNSAKKFDSQFYQEKQDKNNIENYFGSKNHFVDEKPNNFFDNNYEQKKNIKSNLYFSKNKKQDIDFSLSELFKNSTPIKLIPKNIFTGFAVFTGIFALGFGFFAFVGNTFAVKGGVMGSGERAVESIKTAVGHAGQKDFQASGKAMDEAYDEMVFASEEMNSINNMAVFVSEFIPGASQLSSGKHVIEVGKYLTHAGKEANSLAPIITNLIESKGDQSMEDISLLEIYQNSIKHISVIHQDVKQASQHIKEVNLDDIPNDYRDEFSDMKSIFPYIEESLEVTVSGQDAIEDILGANGPRKYLFLFQNNHEMRATGGFIGSYGLLEISNGKITNFKVDGIFNPGGQLIDRIVPPLPIQKISADWSLHDSNWFPNFPTSAEKAIDFYERTGGPTVDGVVTLTPVVMKKILEVTGPVTLDEYDTEVNSDNFMRVIQTEVEEEYDKEENDPKKILADLTPKVFEKIISSKNPKNLVGIVNVISKSLDEKQILVYMRNDYIQDVISQSGWSGEVIDTDKDYLSVINSNVNGFKTDGMVRETIKHSAKIHEDGSVINKVTITRKHEGGRTGFDWWDSVNSDYMRIYVPEGSRLLSVEGQTREINEERLDYNVLGYERDKDIVAEEENRIVDKESGTRIYEEEGKTVFANWVYVSPQETATITYEYILPFKVEFDYDNSGQFGSYAVVYQKQAGSENSVVESEMVLPEDFKLFWETDNEKDLKMKDGLQSDLYHGVVFRVE